jgi:quercetin dioxygenase-like cupin family protein
LPEGFLVTAPDGMPVRVLSIGPDTFMGGAVGYLAPGASYAVHFHYTLEQLSFVVKGVVRVTMAGETRLLRAGDAVTNPPGTTLSFANDGPEPAEVLFVCSPPYPSDDSDTEIVDTHRELSDAERAGRREKISWALEHFRRVVDLRL